LLRMKYIMLERESGETPMVHRMEIRKSFEEASFVARERMIEVSTARLGLPEWWLGSEPHARNWVWYGGVEFQILSCAYNANERMN
jgi:hypothetical protein